jgi:hypothetical protein
MKCIGKITAHSDDASIEKHTQDGYAKVDPESVVRVSERRAFNLISSYPNRFAFVPKSMWKLNGRRYN